MLLILKERARLLYVELLKRISHLIFFFLSRLKRRLRKSHVVDFFTFFRRKRRDLPLFSEKKKGSSTQKGKKRIEQEVVFLQKSNITV